MPKKWQKALVICCLWIILSNYLEGIFIVECHKVFEMLLYGCFLKWWYPQKTPTWSFLVGKPMVVGYHHFRKPPYKRPWSFRKVQSVFVWGRGGERRTGLEILMVVWNWATRLKRFQCTAIVNKSEHLTLVMYIYLQNILLHTFSE